MLGFEPESGADSFWLFTSGSVAFDPVESGEETGNVTGGKVVIGFCRRTNRRRATEKIAIIASAAFLPLDDLIGYGFREGRYSTQECPLRKLHLNGSVTSFPHSPNPIKSYFSHPPVYITNTFASI